MRACKDAVSNCVVLSGGDAPSPVVVYISKMTPVKISDLAPEDQAMVRAQREASLSPTDAQTGEAGRGKDETEVLMALGRVFAGELNREASYYTLGHRHHPLGLLNESGDVSDDALSRHNVSRVDGANLGLYLCFGPSFKSVNSMPAGNIVGIIGLDRYVQKTGTMSTSYFCPPMRSITFQAKPILRVAVEPIRPQDLPALEKGIQALYQYDPVVEVSVESTGQFTISCLGELHLELCLKALSERFAK
jgi:ribosome assembly protein 1